MTYKDVMNEFKEKCRKICISDEYIGTTREELPICGEYSYGVIFVRDDAVKLLIDRIKELEKQCEQYK